MANPESIKNTATSTLRDAASTASSTASNLRDTARDTSHSASQAASKMGEKFIDDAAPRMREAYDQVSERASDLYDRANSWLDEGNNRTYGYAAMAVAAGVVGFFVGRGFRSNSSQD